MDTLPPSYTNDDEDNDTPDNEDNDTPDLLDIY